MTKHRLFKLFFVFTVFTLTNLSPAQITSMQEIYFQSIAYPENFTNYVQQNPQSFGTRFNNHLNVLFARHNPAAQNHMNYCAQVYGYGTQGYLDCCKQDWNAQIVVWILCVREVTLNNTRWEKTMQGQGFIVGKNLAQMLGALEMWMATARLSAQTVGPIIEYN